jgi:hypothetical protein
LQVDDVVGVPRVLGDTGAHHTSQDDAVSGNGSALSFSLERSGVRDGDGRLI